MPHARRAIGQVGARQRSRLVRLARAIARVKADARRIRVRSGGGIGLADCRPADESSSAHPSKTARELPS